MSVLANQKQHLVKAGLKVEIGDDVEVMSAM
jgi:hypothetical protein